MPLIPAFGRFHPPAPGRRDLLPPDLSGRVDFEPEDFNDAIAAHGYRLAWQRRADCPCKPVSYQLTQPSPNCAQCDGSGYLYFGPDEPQDLRGQWLDDVQASCLEDSRAFLIHGIMAPLSARDKRNDQLGTWMFGGSSVTVMAANRLGFRDRLINIDAVMPYTEVVVMPALPDLTLPLRYRVSGGVYLVLDDQMRRYTLGRDFTLDVGRVVFFAGRAPAPGTRVSVHYLTFPCWLVENVGNRDRVQNVAEKAEGGAQPAGAVGFIQHLPTRAEVVLEFIPSGANAGPGN